ncbi:Pre-mRNA cleavage complex 2 protein Pcf11 [Strongyloides ratti]|uniref:Pre-mRNA cleavage complex 2 protein Pcf11 n=1 Tax=Strongyloides ratti TaxID=34506 RepID=A0A090LEU5_STRRB|nr:Pre-mRNA cleavage complex 2 protein Pcf11 [Strongyloides ratti]CEF68262.1 Pre-mRNA cleavage complex 2 protein Pcf11 [Strongyloides ratti]
MDFQDDGVKEFTIVLDTLKDNNGKTINMLTLFAVELEKQCSSIAKIIESRIYSVDTSDKMLLTLYVMDSIMKTPKLKTNCYINEFSKNLINIFVYVFKAATDNVRRSLHKMRRTWDSIISHSLLYKLDLAVNEIDSNWPVVSDISNKPLTSTNKNGIPANSDGGKKIIDIVKKSVDPIDTTRSQLQSKIKNPQNDKLLINPKSAIEVKAAVDPRKTAESRTLIDTKAGINSRMAIDPRKTMDQRTAMDPRLGIDHKPPMDIKPLGDHRPVGDIRVAVDPRIGIDRRTSVDSRLPMDPRMIPDVRKNPGDLRQNQQMKEYKRPDTGTTLKSSPQYEKQPLIGQKQGNQIVELSQTTVPQIAGIKRTSPIPVPNENKDDFRKRKCVDTKFSYDHSSMLQPIRVNTPPVLVSPPIPNGFSPNFSHPINSNSPVPRVPVNIALSSNIPTTIIKNDTPRIEGIQANNRIFVDGKAYEVLFVDNQPIIERNCLPHKIYFFGNPRKVTIDGKEYTLPFRESKTVIIGGLHHVIRFGAPSRELIMNEFPFKGSFGGPPIIANINGRKHEIRLGGPPPEVRIEPEPSFELLPALKKMQRDAKIDPEVKKVEPLVQDIKSLLAKLKDQGIIKSGQKPGENSLKEKQPEVSSNKSKLLNLKEPAKKVTLANISFKDLPDNVLSLDPNLIYQATLEVLYQSRNVCPNCGLQMEKSDDEMFQKHMDWHFRENTRLIQNKNASVRPWNMTGEKWLKFSEQLALTHNSSNNSDTEGSDGERNSGSADILSSEVHNKCCNVCGEQFEEYYDEDDDLWKVKSCIVVKNIAYHVSCSNDMALTEEHTSSTTINKKRQVETSVF